MFSQGPKQPLKVTIIYPVIEASQKELKRTISHWRTARNSNLIFCSSVPSSLSLINPLDMTLKTIPWFEPAVLKGTAFCSPLFTALFPGKGRVCLPLISLDGMGMEVNRA